MALGEISPKLRGNISSTQAYNVAGNTTGLASVGTNSISTPFNISAAGIISAGWSSNSFIISGPGTALNTVFSGGISGGNTSGNTGLATGQLVFAGSNNITLSGSTLGGSMSVTISGPSFTSIAGTGFTTGSTVNAQIVGTNNSNGLSFVQPYMTRTFVPDNGNFTAVSAPGNASLSIQYIAPYQPITASRVDCLMLWSGASSATTNTCAIAVSAYAAIYTRNVSTLSSLSSGSTQTTYTYASNTAGQTQLIGAAIRPVSVPMNINMAPGEYFVGFNFITATSSIGLSTTNLGQTFSVMGGNELQTVYPYAEFTAGTATSTNQFGGMGVFTAATTGIPSTIGLANIAQTGASLSQANIALVFRNN